jgi:nucleotidyltransferase/DNA polymerase involved in DNA repair
LRVAFVYIPRFACVVEASREPRLAGMPVVVGEGERPKRVAECSAEASEAGVRPGMRLREALSLCPGVTILEPDNVLYAATWHRVLAALDEISPEVEDARPGEAYLNAGGLDGHYRDEGALAARIRDAVREASGLGAAIGIARSKFSARTAATVAHERGEAVVVDDEAVAEFLAPLPASLLDVSPELVARLHVFGLDTIGEVARISLPQLQAQFGPEGRRLWKLANGLDDDQLRPRPRQEAVQASLSFEAPVGGIDILVAAGRQLLSRLRLPLRGRAVREMTLQAELSSGRGWERQMVLREAVSDNDRLSFVLRSTLQNTPPPAAVRSLTLRLSKLAGETGKQMYMGERGRMEHQLQEAIRQLKARYGASPIYRCVDVEPWSVIPEERQILIESDV